jgi:hypothetical protein
MQVLKEFAAISIYFSCSSKKSDAKVDDPTGKWSYQKPVVSSADELDPIEDGLIKEVTWCVGYPWQVVCWYPS